MGGKSLLNPHAAPYVPLSTTFSSRIGFDGDNKAGKNILGASENREDIGKAASYQHSNDVSVEGTIQSLEKLHVSDESSSEMGLSFYPDDDTFLDTIDAEQSLIKDQNMLECLFHMFPDYSAESLGELFSANNCDLNVTIDMLEQLESVINVDEEFPEYRKNLHSCQESSSSSHKQSDLFSG